jgi:hypothetical protein
MIYNQKRLNFYCLSIFPLVTLSNGLLHIFSAFELEEDNFNPDKDDVC